MAYGALSNAIQAALAEKKHGKVVTNWELVLRARGLLFQAGIRPATGPLLQR
jgi:hypothetical protein